MRTTPSGINGASVAAAYAATSRKDEAVRLRAGDLLDSHYARAYNSESDSFAHR